MKMLLLLILVFSCTDTDHRSAAMSGLRSANERPERAGKREDFAEVIYVRKYKDLQNNHQRVYCFAVVKKAPRSFCPL